jgi:predicted nucleic acid-binding protein
LSRFVVDASVAIKWLLPEIHSEDAERLLDEGVELSAPDLIRAEVGNIVWKRWRRGEIPLEKARLALQVFRGYSLDILSSETLLDEAWDIAQSLNRSFYDSLYLALAVYQDSPMVTADRRLYNAIQGSSRELPIVWVEDVP